MNDAIRAPKVRLIDEDGNMVGVLSVREALEMAADAGLDLVEISPNVEPPVCKILDYGKFRFEAQKKKSAERKRQNVVEIKEIKLRPGIEENDFQTKLRAMRRFLGEGNKVKITMRFRGREMAHQDIGLNVLNRVCTELTDLIRVEVPPKTEGKQIFLMIAPK